MNRTLNIILVRLLIVSLLLGIFASCSVQEYVPEDQLLYESSELTIIDTIGQDNAAQLQPNLESVIYPKPNPEFLGMSLSLYFYYKAQQENPGFITRFLNKEFGREPVYLSDVEVDQTEKLLENRLENNGFFYSLIESEIKTDTLEKTASSHYKVRIEKPYTLRKYKIERDSLDSLAIFYWIEKYMEKSLFRQGEDFSLSRFKNERKRIEKYLKAKGYYNFKSEFLLFQADTNSIKKRKFDLYLSIKENVPQKALVPYVIDEVNVYPDFSIDTKEKEKDTVRVKGVNFIQSGVYFKPKLLRPFILLRPGQLYSPKEAKYTSRRISSIGNYKFVNIEYEIKDPQRDSLKRRHLRVRIELSPLNRQAIRAKLAVTTQSNNFTGPGLELSYINRNLFKGGETFRITGNVSYERQFFSKRDRGLSSLKLSLTPSLTFPRLVFPWDLNYDFKYSIPKTQIKLDASYLDREKLYTLNAYSGSFGYLWTANAFVTHKLTPLSLSYVNLGNTSSRFEKILNENPFLKRSFEQQFIPNLMYSFIYDEVDKTDNRGELYFKFNFDIAGNIADLLAKKQKNGVSKLLGLEYAQYAKADIDLQYHYATGHSGQELIGRIFVGFGLPYGNSTSLPFVKQYFSGGPYSVRAFPIRSLGPGTYDPGPSDIGSYFDQAGDIKLEANLEFRFPIFSFVEGALFVDAGNVWLYNNNEALPGGQFSSNFMNELGIGTGFGIRFNIQGFVLRFDLAAPLKRPAGPWDFEYKEPLLNFAIGYPF